MTPLLSDNSLKEFLELTTIPQEKKEEYLSLLPTLKEEGRILLFDTLVKYFQIDSEEKRVIKALEFFREFSKDGDYDKLTTKLEALDNEVEIPQ